MAELSDKQKLWLAFYLDKNNPATFLNKAAATLAAGYKNASSGTQIYKNVTVKEHITEYLISNGATKQMIREKFFELMNATETKFFQKDGVVIETRDVESLGIQLKAAVEAAKLDGLYEPEKHEHSGALKIDRQMDQRALKDVIDSFK